MSAPDRIWAGPWYRGDKSERDWSDEEWFVTTEPGAPDDAWVRADLHDTLRAERDALAARVAELEADRDTLLASIKSDKPRKELFWARAHVAELEVALRGADALAERVERLEGALIEHNDLLRSAHAIASRAIMHEEFRVIANWDAFHDRVIACLHRYHEVTNEARAALSTAQGPQEG
jgi:hypothetical protein